MKKRARKTISISWIKSWQSTIAILLSFFSVSNGQNFNASLKKTTIDTSTYGKWNQLDTKALLSNDGAYVWFSRPTKEEPLASVIQNMSKSWTRKIPNARRVTFSPDNKYAMLEIGKDSLSLLKLGTTDITYINHVARYSFLYSAGINSLIYWTNDSEHQLLALNLANGESKMLARADQVYFNIADNELNTCNGIVVLNKAGVDDQLCALQLTGGFSKVIWTGKKVGELIFNLKGDHISFIGTDSADRQNLYYYAPTQERAESLIKDAALPSGSHLGQLLNFNIDGSKIFLKINREPKVTVTQSATTGVDIWSYFDPKPQSLQLIEKQNQFRAQQFTYVVDAAQHKLLQLEGIGNQMQSKFHELKNSLDDYVLIRSEGEGPSSERHWNRTAWTKMWLVSINSGNRKLISEDPAVSATWLSPDEKYVLYYNSKLTNYISYEIATGKRINLTCGIATRWTTLDPDDEIWAKWLPIGVAGWLNTSHTALIHDQYDVFQIDLSGKSKPINLTSGFGKKHDIYFHFGYDELSGKTIYNSKKEFLLHGFDHSTKNTGFFWLKLGRVNKLEKLTMQPYKLAVSQKTKNQNAYLVYKEGTNFYPNYLLTSDFQHFTQLTDIQPQRGYNWLRSELINYKQLDGQKSQAILYKPENFDPQRKYPVIFTYYERLTDRLNNFLYPEWSTSVINIPSYVSRGYLVAVVDIHFKFGNPGQSALYSIKGLANSLSKYSWLDRKRMGLNGHSYGGYMTEYIVSHSKMFAAAVAASGWSNFISASNRIRTNGNYAQDYYEVGKQRMGGTLWEKPAAYVAASPIFKAHKVTAPLLMVNNHDDNDVQFFEGVQFFNALRRLGKKAWMLQYDGEKHALDGLASAKDYTIREQQFFDHYLKGAPAPKWMTRGIPAEKKGIELGYELEPTGVEPGPGLLKTNK